jgi:hypothetical protein
VLPVLVLAALATGCSSGDSAGEGPPPTIGAESSAASASTPSTSPSASKPTRPPAFGQKVAARTAQVHEGTIAVTGRRRKVADALVGYMTARLEAYNTGVAQVGELAAVSRGAALNDVQAYVQQLQESGHRTVGEVWVDVSRVKISGRRATITSCMPNATADVDKSGRVVDQNPAAAYAVDAGAHLVARDTWVIETIKFTGRPSCAEA